MSAIYTRRGDAGNTENGLDEKMSKASLFCKVFGYIDELNVMIGWVKTACFEDGIRKQLHHIQSSLFEISAALAHREENQGVLKCSDDYLLKINEMEDEIDNISKKCGPLNHFLYPGKNELSVRWHMARVICRHAERNLVALSCQYKVSPIILAYINRLSDWFFIKAYEADVIPSEEGIQ